MRTRIQRWGHSPAMRIPKRFAQEAKLAEQAEVDLAVVNGKIVITPVAKRPIRLADLLSGITKRNLHDGVDVGVPVGREAWRRRVWRGKMSGSQSVLKEARPERRNVFNGSTLHARG